MSKPAEPAEPAEPDDTLLPGLVDAHVHLYMEATADPERRRLQLDTTYRERRPVMARALRSHAAAGIRAVRDGGDYGGFALRYRQERAARHRQEGAARNQQEGAARNQQEGAARHQQEGAARHQQEGAARNQQEGAAWSEGDAAAGGDPEPVVRAAGRAWRAPGRYGRLIGRPPREGERLGDAVRRDLAATPRIDHVKITQSGVNSLSVFGKSTAPQFSVSALREAVEAAHAAGRTVMVHANGPEPVRRAIEAGCDSIEHGYFATLDVLARTIDTATVWVPTLAPMWAFAEAPGVPTQQRDIARRTLDHQLETVGRAARAGVTIVAGSDAGSVGVEHGPGLWAELWLLRQAGLSADQVIEAATTHGAHLLGLKEAPGPHLRIHAPPDKLFTSPTVPTVTWIRAFRTS